MASRIGPGPVFVYESLIFARRRQVYAGRMLFVLALLLGLWAAWWSNLSSVAFDGWGEGSPGVLQALARAGQAFFSAMAGIQLAMVLLVAPSATAGAICHDRAGHPGADGDHRPLRRRDRAGQAQLAAGPDPRPARLRPAGHGPGRAFGRGRHPGAVQSLRGVGRGRRAGMCAGDGDLGPCRQDAGGDHGRAGPLDRLAVEPADLVEPGASRACAGLVLQGQSLRPGLCTLLLAGLRRSARCRAVRGRGAGGLGGTGRPGDRALRRACSRARRSAGRGKEGSSPSGCRHRGDGSRGCRGRRSTAIPCCGASGIAAGRRGWRG